MGDSTIFSNRLSLFTGKGGVGKSTLVAGLAMEAARQGRRPLIVEMGHRASMCSIFGTDKIGHSPVCVADGVYATNMDLDLALKDFVSAELPLPHLAARLLESPSIRRFLGAAPAVPEVLTLHRLEGLLAERGGGAPRWDPVLVDFDATGHALMFLELPLVLDGLLSSGPLRGLLDRTGGLLSDQSQTRLHLVAIPRHLVVQETRELFEHLQARPVVPLGTIFVNRVPSCPVSPEEKRAVELLEGKVAADTSLGAELRIVREAMRCHADIESHLAHFNQMAMPTVQVPMFHGGVGLAELSAIGRLAALGAPHSEPIP